MGSSPFCVTVCLSCPVHVPTSYVHAAAGPSGPVSVATGLSGPISEVLGASSPVRVRAGHSSTICFSRGPMVLTLWLQVLPVPSVLPQALPALHLLTALSNLVHVAWDPSVSVSVVAGHTRLVCAAAGVFHSIRADACLFNPVLLATGPFKLNSMAVVASGHICAGVGHSEVILL